MLLGLFAFNPVEARTSPGRILIVELARKLKAEGFRYLDLTPGRQLFKEQLANSHEELVLPTFYFSKRARLIADLKESTNTLAKRVLRWVRIDDPHKRQQFVDQLIGLRVKLKRTTPGSVCRRLARMIYRRAEYLYYGIDCSTTREDQDAPQDSEIGIQRYADLLACVDSSPRLANAEFLERSLRRFNAGDVLYSITKSGVLAHHGWLQKTQEASSSEYSMKLLGPKGSVTLDDFYTVPSFRRQGLFTRTLQQIIRDCGKSGVPNVLIAVDRNNWQARNVIENVGFSVFRGYRRTQFLQWVWEKSFGPETGPLT